MTGNKTINKTTISILPIRPEIYKPTRIYGPPRIEHTKQRENNYRMISVLYPLMKNKREIENGVVATLIINFTLQDFSVLDHYCKHRNHY